MELSSITTDLSTESFKGSVFSFRLNEEYVDGYRDKKPPFGYSDAAGNSVGEITFLRTYSRLKEDGTKETWVDVCERVINGMYSLQKDHCKKNRLPWNDVKAQASAKEAFDRLFNLKWTPPGRGLWVMGTNIVNVQKNSAALQNCAFVSTAEMNRHNPAKPFAFLMEASMLGVGVGFDDKGADKEFIIYQPKADNVTTYTVPDTREGWVDSVTMLINSYLKSDQQSVEFVYDEVRPAGTPIKTFGGVAAGPDPLIKLHNHIRNKFNGRAGELLTRVDIADIGNLIGVCVVSGNVRRCLPEGTWVHTFDGPKKIEDVTTQDYVVTPQGKYRVTNFFDQGVQKTVKIVHQFGEFECTPNHQVAVFTDIDNYEFKMAANLVPGDRLVWDSNGIDGAYTELPSFEWLRKDKDYTGVDITVPELTGDVAWLLGQLMGDGYVFLPNGKTPNGYVSFAVAKNTPRIKDKILSILPAFGVLPIVTDGDGECWKVSVYNNQFAHYMSAFKLSHNRFSVPEFISNGTREVRSGFLMGLFDADGSSQTRPLNAVTNTNINFVTEIQKVYASLGIATKMRLRRSADYRENWKPLYSLDVVGVENVQAFTEMAVNHSSKFIPTAKTKRSANGFTFDTKMAKASFRINWSSKNITSARLADKHNFYSTLKPVEVIEVIDSGREVQTYDIEVDSVHEFVAEGFVVHNSAELLIGRLDDENFLNLKNAQVYPERNSYDPEAPGWGWMSNNSVEASVGADLSNIIEGITLNGEPGVIWMDVSRKYGRLADGPNNKDWRVAGYNPSLAPGTKVYTTDGVFPIEALEGRDFKVKNLDGQISAAYCWKSGTDKPVYSVNLAGGWSYVATKEHKWPVWNADKECWEKKTTLELTAGDLIPNLKQESLFPEGIRGTYDEGFLVGWNLGDGWQTDRKDGRRQYGFMVSEDDRNNGIDAKLSSLLNEIGVKTDFIEKDEINVSAQSLRDLFDSFGVQHKTDGLPDAVWDASVSDDFRRGLVDGLFSADGSVTVSDRRISIAQASEKMIDDIASLLGFFGIKTSKQKISRSKHEAFPDKYSESDELFTRYVLRVGSINNIIHFSNNFKFSRLDKQARVEAIIETTKRMDDTSWFTEVKGVTDAGISDVWDVTVYDQTHAFQLDHCITGNCAEQSLESYECCVSGDTKIQTRNGLIPIVNVVGEDVEIWNGEEWTNVVPFFTGMNDLYRVTLSDGSYLDVTPGHEWSVRSGRDYKKVTTAQLRPGDKIPEFDLGVFEGGEPFEDAYTWGWFMGDGYVDGRYAIGIVQDNELASVGSSLNGRKRSMQKDYRTGSPWHPVVLDIPIATAARMRNEDNIPQEVFGWDQDSLARFFGGWVDTDGTVSHELNTDHYVLYGTEGKLRDAQLLLRRIGINHASLRLHQSAGVATNLGVRKADQYRLLIPSYECDKIKTILKKAERIGSRFKHNNAHEGSVIDAARKQKVVSIEHIAADQPTFCFNEPKRGMGVFGNALTYQCTLVETYLNRHESLEDFKRTLKFAYLYAKTVTLLPTHWEETNAIMQRNRRIGTSISGVANFADRVGMPMLREWMDQGYQTVQRYDNVYSEWLGIRESIKTTTVKPSGCQKPETLVFTNSGILALNELGQIDGEVWQDSNIGKKAPNEYGELKDIGKFYNNGLRPTKKIKLSSGLTLEATYNHQYRVLRNGEWEWIRADEICVDDIIPYVCGLYDNQTNFKLKDAPPAARNAINIVTPVIDYINSDIAWFLGLYFGDGSNHNKGIRIAGSMKHLEDLEKALLIAEEYLGLTGKIYYHTKSDKNADLYINSTHLLKWLEINGLLKTKSKDVSIPLPIRCSSPQVIDSFISGYCTADGIINNCGRAIVTTSKVMAEQLVVALRAIGSDASVREMPPTKASWGSAMRYWVQEKLGRNGDTTRLSKKVQIGLMQLDELGLKNAMPDFVTDIANGETYTMDIEVPEGNTYIANSYISHNTVSILAGESPGVHWTPGGKYFLRAIRFSNDDPMLPLFRMANYRVEPASESPDTTSVVFFPIVSDAKRSEKDVTIFEKMALAASAQRYWSDNSVSVTISFDSEEEKQHVGTVLHMYDGQLKTVSFLPQGNFTYPQMPYTQITEEEYIEASSNLFPIDFSGIYAGLAADAVGESYCTTSSCEIKFIIENAK